jgi:hypothetical protein
MESVEPDRWTEVLMTRKGRPVRMDFELISSEPPGAGADPPGRRVFTQEIDGTPFERVLGEAITEIVLEPAEAGTRVTIALSQKLRGYSRTGGFLLRRATRAKLDDALQELERILTPR